MGRLLLLALAVSVIAQGAAAAGSSEPPARSRTVPCNETIDQTRFPYVGSSRPLYRYRTVLGAISVPPAYMAQIVNTDEQPWPYWRKAGLVVRADGRPVTVSVPSRWRDRLRITWGNGGNGVFTTIRFAGCTAGADLGQAFAGGFVVREPACVPLVFRVGERSATVRFGLGRRCA